MGESMVKPHALKHPGAHILMPSIGGQGLRLGDVVEQGSRFKQLQVQADTVLIQQTRQRYRNPGNGQTVPLDMLRHLNLGH